jgi:hypothetical protein
MERFQEHLVYVRGIKFNISAIATHIREEDNHQGDHLNLKLILENRNRTDLKIWESIFIAKRNKNPNHTLSNRDEGPSASILTRLTEPFLKRRS